MKQNAWAASQPNHEPEELGVDADEGAKVAADAGAVKYAHIQCRQLAVLHACMGMWNDPDVVNVNTGELPPELRCITLLGRSLAMGCAP